MAKRRLNSVARLNTNKMTSNFVLERILIKYLKIQKYIIDIPKILRIKDITLPIDAMRLIQSSRC